MRRVPTRARCATPRSRPCSSRRFPTRLTQPTWLEPRINTN